jgi:hypothetical protein
MKKILLVMMLFVVSNSLSAQSANGQVATASKYQGLKIVFQLTSADTVIHQTLMSQLKK